ncbi:MAG: sulfite exporter TauE/SafE family protein [Methylococcaceae bacterium]|nr:sulfite exporter TauE/SafE family protein [Methylococcaceae bacterium]
MNEMILLSLAFGCLAGILSGLFGIGGGAVIVPFLAWYFTAAGFAPDLIMVTAVATSLATIVVTSFSAVYAHHRLGAVDWAIVLRLSPGILLGAALGSLAAKQLPVAWFKLIFALFLLFVATRLLLGGKGEGGKHWRPTNGLLAPAGLAIGSVSAILGIGGGTLSVPFLVKCRYVMRHAVAISSACGFPIALAGSASYIVLGWHDPLLPPYSLGYIYLPAFTGIIATSIAFAPLGARLAHRLPTVKLKRTFSLILFVVGGNMFWQALHGF